MLKRQIVLFVFVLHSGLLLSTSASAQQGVLSLHPLTADYSQQWKLPGRLDEISGLALSPGGRLFAVDDERAVIYELDYEDGNIIKAFGFGNPVERGDFEGIAFLDDHLWLTTSDGEIYAGREGRDGELVAFRRWSTNLGRQCEIEGLGQDTESRTLLLVCKQLRKKSTLAAVSVFTWSADDAVLVEGGTLKLPVAQILRAIGSDRFNPSGIAVAGQGSSLLIVASRQQAVAEISASGQLIYATRLPLHKRHRQAEGIEVTSALKLLISDEGGKHKARLAVYTPRDGA